MPLYYSTAQQQQRFAGCCGQGVALKSPVGQVVRTSRAKWAEATADLPEVRTPAGPKPLNQDTTPSHQRHAVQLWARNELECLYRTHGAASSGCGTGRR